MYGCSRAEALENLRRKTGPGNRRTAVTVGIKVFQTGRSGTSRPTDVAPACQLSVDRLDTRTDLSHCQSEPRSCGPTRLAAWSQTGGKAHSAAIPVSITRRIVAGGVTVGYFTQNAVLFLWILDIRSHLGQSLWVPAEFSSEECDFPVVVFHVVIFAEPDDIERILVIFVMRDNVATATNCANASSQHAAFD